MGSPFCFLETFIPFACYLTHFTLLISSSNGNAIERVPLPPPCSASASLGTSKLSQSSSFHPSAPSLKGRDATNGISQLGKSSFGNHVSAQGFVPFLVYEHLIFLAYWTGSPDVVIEHVFLAWCQIRAWNIKPFSIMLFLQLCSICIYNPKDMAFGCGHQVKVNRVCYSFPYFILSE